MHGSILTTPLLSEGTGSMIIFYHMAWQDFTQFDLYNLTYNNAEEGWAVAWDNGTIPGYRGAPGKMTYVQARSYSYELVFLQFYIVYLEREGN